MLTVATVENSASRAVDRFGLMNWPQVPAHDPRELIRLVREADKANEVAPDDATTLRWQFWPTPTPTPAGGCRQGPLYVAERLGARNIPNT